MRVAQAIADLAALQVEAAMQVGVQQLAQQAGPPAPPPTDDRSWFSTAQAAAYAGRHVVTVRRALEAGELHGGQPKTGARWRIHRDCLDAWVARESCAHGEGGRS